MTKEIVLVYLSGQIITNMKVNGIRIKKMDREYIQIMLVIYMMENGKMIKLMDMAYYNK